MAKNKLPTTSAPVAMDRDRDADDMKYRAKDALSTIKRAEEYKSDKDLMKHVKACAKAEMKTLKKLQNADRANIQS